MFKQIAAVLLVVLVAVSLTGCVSAGAGLKSYVDSIDGYEFCILTAGFQLKSLRPGYRVTRFD
jgi:hypothetical protein